jgi:2',3'-cyclic-nucleotide 2'-phosphodiesterase (5'-nucleotidase family)
VYGDLEDVEDLIRNTDGFDVVLDAHSHTVIEGMTVTDKGGNEVLLSSTGTKFEYIGKLTISEGELKTELIKTEEYEKTDPVVDACIEQIYAEYEEQAGRKVASSEVDLITQDAEGNRLVRRYETNLGDLCADTFRYAVDADIGYMNGGSIRADMLKGDITYTHLLNVLPFNNTVVLAEVTGQAIKDMMEMAMKIWPEENGSFPHVSGLTFSVNTSIPSSVQLNEFEEFIGVSGDYRVYDLKVYDRESGTYQPLDLNATYTLAASNFILLECGSGMKMLENAKILQNDGILDVEAMERYITEALDGVIGEEYREVKTNVTFTEGMPEVSEDADTDIATDPVTDTDADVPADTDVPTGTDTDVPAKPVNSTVWVIFIAAGAVAVIVLLAFLIKKKGPAKG